jgi:tetratricopeptide (TPR) repeat protein
VLLDAPTTERYLYLPLGGAALVLGWAACRSRGVTPAAVVIVTAFAAQSVSRQAMWRSDDTLWDAVRADHDSPRACDHFAKELRSRALRADPSRARKLLEESLDDAHRAIDLWCAFEGTDHERNKRARDAELTASNVCHRLGRDQEALFHANEAIRIDETADELGYYDRALALLELAYPSEAYLAMRRALEIRPARAGKETDAFFARADEKAFPFSAHGGVPVEAVEIGCPARRGPPPAK